MTSKYLKILSLLFVAIFAGCTSETDDDPSDFSGKDSSQDKYEQVIFGAKVIKMGNTRAEGDIPVKDQRLNLLFLSSNGWEEGIADFNYQGIAYSERFDNTGSPLDLLWSYVSPDEFNGETYSFYLDNLPEEYNISDPNDITKVLLPDDNPFKATKYEDDSESDLWWGGLQGVGRTKIETVDLNHVMARVSLKVYFDNSAVGEEKYPISANISNIFQRSVSFDRLTGTLGLPDSPDELPFTLVEDEEGWEESTDDTGMKYYTSAEYILPPQEFVANARPRLTVKVKSGKSDIIQTYSGLLPQVMYLEGENGVSTLWTMSFLRSYSLTLSVKISNEAADLQFLPVSILDWWPVGTKTLTGIQASLSEEEDFEKLIEAYYSATDDSQFYKWGFEDSEGTWHFNIFRNITIEAAKYAGKMKEKPDFPYEFNILNSMVTVTLNDGSNVNLSGDEGNRQLKALLNEGIYPSKQ